VLKVIEAAPDGVEYSRHQTCQETSDAGACKCKCKFHLEGLHGRGSDPWIQAARSTLLIRFAATTWPLLPYAREFEETATATTIGCLRQQF
jgi:hypothetical protein